MVKRLESEICEDLKNLVLHIVEELVDHSDEVSCDVIPAATRTVVELRTHRKDVGQVVGREGQVISGIRTILSAFAGRHGTRIDMDYVTDHENRAARTGNG